MKTNSLANMAFDRKCLYLLLLSHSLSFFHSLSKKHKDQPWGIDVHDERYEVNYWPGDSKSGMFGGNSNWRGPICKDVFSFFALLRC